MDKCSYFIKNKALFGSFPTQTEVEMLEKIGVSVFVDLTSRYEPGLTSYQTSKSYISYPIADNYIPDDSTTFCKLILNLCDVIETLKEGEKMYIHCKGGHGRSGTVVACILTCYYNIDPDEALVLTNTYHNDRKVMREKWRRIGAPQTERQKNFVRNLYSVDRLTYKDILLQKINLREV